MCRPLARSGGKFVPDHDATRVADWREHAFRFGTLRRWFGATFTDSLGGQCSYDGKPVRRCRLTARLMRVDQAGAVWVLFGVSCRALRRWRPLGRKWAPDIRNVKRLFPWLRRGRGRQSANRHRRRSARRDRHRAWLPTPLTGGTSALRNAFHQAEFGFRDARSKRSPGSQFGPLPCVRHRPGIRHAPPRSISVRPDPAWSVASGRGGTAQAIGQPDRCARLRRSSRALRIIRTSSAMSV